MRAATIALLLTTACSTTDTTIVPSVLRPERADLLHAANARNGIRIQAVEQGSWRLRVAGNGDQYEDECWPGWMRGQEPARVAPPANYNHSTDDNDHFAEFLTCLADARAEPTIRGHVLDLDVRDRCFVQIVDGDGAAMAEVPVTVFDDLEQRVVWRGKTHGDGRTPFYPAVAGASDADTSRFFVEVPLADRVLRRRWQGCRDVRIRLPGPRKAARTRQVDVAFVIDTTLSMADEITAIKTTLLATARRLLARERVADLRFGAVLYRDLGDAYVTARHDFTGDIDTFEALLRGVLVAGGGNRPESLGQGLAVAVEELSWREQSAKVAFVLADAGPHLDHPTDVPVGDSLQAAVAEGVRIHTVAASGIDSPGCVALRQIAQFTRGRFASLAPGGTAKASELGTFLDARIRDEIAAKASAEPE